MAEVEFRFPSKQPYAYVGFKGTVEEAAKLNVEALATLYANALVAFALAEQRAIDYMVTGESETLEPPKLEAYSDEDAVAGAIKDQLGATEIDSAGEAPYKAAPPAAKAKPWETEKPKPTATVDVEGW